MKLAMLHLCTILLVSLPVRTRGAVSVDFTQLYQLPRLSNLMTGQLGLLPLSVAQLAHFHAAFRFRMLTNPQILNLGVRVGRSYGFVLGAGSIAVLLFIHIGS